jgi:hypothetical protein
MGRTVGIMQPYFLPYMGYWQLIARVDRFVVYDTVQYTKKGWINRNRFLQNGKDEIFSLPLKADSSLLYVRDRELSPAFDRKKLVRQFVGAYGKAPFFAENFPVIESIVMCPEPNLFGYIENSIATLCAYLGIKTEIIRSSEIKTGHENLKGQDKVLDICKALGAESYVNPIGGVDLYKKEDFLREGIRLTFLRSRLLDYACFGRPCLPHLSILDVMMFCAPAQVKTYLEWFDLVE